ncbi:hypothetical protein ACS0TY_019842 [Phlomoides rotata]
MVRPCDGNASVRLPWCLGAPDPSSSSLFSDGRATAMLKGLWVDTVHLPRARTVAVRGGVALGTRAAVVRWCVAMNPPWPGVATVAIATLLLPSSLSLSLSLLLSLLSHEIDIDLAEVMAVKEGVILALQVGVEDGFSNCFLRSSSAACGVDLSLCWFLKGRV